MNKTNAGSGQSSMDPGSIALKLGIEALKRTAPTGIAWVTTYIRGVNLLMLGPSGSGKTSFTDYLAYGILVPESEHITTLEEEATPTFSVAIGRNESLKLKVRKSLDQPGQIGPLAHANLIAEKRPHAVIIMLDASEKTEDTKAWLIEFCDHFERHLLKSPTLKKKMSSFMVCFNKRDKVANSGHYTARVRAARSVLTDRLSNVMGSHYTKAVPIMPCVSVLTEQHGTSLIDAVIAMLAKQVK